MSQSPKAASEDLLKRFAAYISAEGLKSTRQRDTIVAAFAEMGGHVSVDELHAYVRTIEPAVGHATVYRTLKLLVDANFASLRNFGGDVSRFELRGEDHHDHIICEECGHIVEFHDEEIERLQEELVRKLGFELVGHRHELFVRCLDAECSRRPAKKD